MSVGPSSDTDTNWALDRILAPSAAPRVITWLSLNANGAKSDKMPHNFILLLSTFHSYGYRGHRVSIYLTYSAYWLLTQKIMAEQLQEALKNQLP